MNKYLIEPEIGFTKEELDIIDKASLTKKETEFLNMFTEERCIMSITRTYRKHAIALLEDYNYATYAINLTTGQQELFL